VSFLLHLSFSFVFHFRDKQTFFASSSGNATASPWINIPSMMDQIFGKGSIDDIFSPCNGLLLHKHALEKGYLADIDPQDPGLGGSA
jgi:hypothetical protein